MSETDLELLARYARQNAEGAFAEIVRRHLDLVYSAALRQVRSPQLAEEVAQVTFLKLARHARQLAPDSTVVAWLYQVARHEATDVVRREACRQLREQIAAETNAMNANATDWIHLEPLLDDAVHALDNADRAAVLLRYFENMSLREVGQTLGISDDAAQKRVSRAVERLREFFAKRGITIGASGLILVISTNAVQAAPAGLLLTISAATAAVSQGAVISTTTTATRAITLKKTLITAGLVVAAGAGLYEARQASRESLKASASQPIEIRGRSEYRIAAADGTLTGWSDTNDFWIAVDECKWRMALHSLTIPGPPTQLGDDGTNYYVFVPGAGGTCLMGETLTPYHDSATVFNSAARFAHPQHHGRAVWLLFASKCVMSSRVGDVGNVVGVPVSLKQMGKPDPLDFFYERFDDLQKNTFGPSMVRIFFKIPDTNNVVVAELEVLDSKVEDGYVIPRSAELRIIDQRPGSKVSKVIAVYRLSDISLKRDAPLVHPRPAITNATLISDFRHAGYSFEYVSSKWTTVDEAIQLLESGNVRPH